MSSLAISFTENSILEKEGKINIFFEKLLKKNYWTEITENIFIKNANV